MIWSGPAERRGDGLGCPTNFSLSLQVEWKVKSNDKLKFVGQPKRCHAPLAAALLI